MAEKDFNRKLVRIAHTVTIEPFSETSVLAASNARGNVQFDDFTQFDQSYPSKVAHDVTDVFRQKLFYVMVASPSTSFM